MSERSEQVVITLCARCGDELGEDPVVRGGLMFCCPACAFEAVRDGLCSPDCHCRGEDGITLRP